MCDTGTGEQMAKLHDSLMMMTMMMTTTMMMMMAATVMINI
jgi:hypothetical protein